MIPNPALTSPYEKVVQIKPDSFIIMSGLPPVQYANHWVYIVSFVSDHNSVVINVSDHREGTGDRYEVQAGDTIPIGAARYEVLAVEPADGRYAWVEIDSTPQP